MIWLGWVTNPGHSRHTLINGMSIYPNGPKWSQMDTHIYLFTQMDPNGLQMDPNGYTHLSIYPNGPKWTQMDTQIYLFTQMDQNGDPNGHTNLPKWNQMDPDGPKWTHKFIY